MRRAHSGAVLGLAAILLTGPVAPVRALEVGDKAPDFRLPGTTIGVHCWRSKPFCTYRLLPYITQLSLHDFKKSVVLFSFIGAFTPTSAREVAALQLDLPKFQSRNAQVMGISSDFQPAQFAWSEKMGLAFPLLSDVSRTTLEAYGFLNTDPKDRLYRYGKRAYVIIDWTGIVRYKKVLEKPGGSRPR